MSDVCPVVCRRAEFRAAASVFPSFFAPSFFAGLFAFPAILSPFAKTGEFYRKALTMPLIFLIIKQDKNTLKIRIHRRKTNGFPQASLLAARAGGSGEKKSEISRKSADKPPGKAREESEGESGKEKS